jgi:hypothetical protein
MNEENLLPVFGQVTAVGTFLLTLITFGFAFIAIPIIGPFCPKSWDCIHDVYRREHHQTITDLWPHDYYWVILALPQVLIYLCFIVAIHQSTPPSRQVFSLLALAFSIMACSILFACYFTQLGVVHPSLLKGESEGIDLFTMYNDHGVFIALEETAYLLVAISLLTLAPSIHPVDRLRDHVLRALLVLAGVGGILALPLIVWWYGWDRSYRYEVTIITIDWTTLLIVSPLWALRFRKQQSTARGGETKTKTT